eukprot:CAMPEP_0174276062 /NCGR_PEP_ID=MMETSP0439-20130205/60179_1 /TAXON_ID=0 /ORGANISM="Stereomyxa ramosa, Strain Chinc5" /LENGTH=667 /DNA_ID=CAMNT_0015368251 /DNA_START=460 /DNA_END=2463 /DNA_ORIENTATION=-
MKEDEPYYNIIGQQEGMWLSELGVSWGFSRSRIVKMKSRFWSRGRFCIVLEHFEDNLHSLLLNQPSFPKPLPPFLALSNSINLLSPTVKQEQCSKKFGGLDMHDMLFISKNLMIALAYLEKHGIIHADIRPENILVNYNHEKTKERYSVALADFGNGMSRRVISKGFSSSKDMYRESVPQSIPYRAPEVLWRQKFDTKIDMWSLGCVLFEMWSGKRLFSMEVPEWMSGDLSEIDRQLEEQLKVEMSMILGGSALISIPFQKRTSGKKVVFAEGEVIHLVEKRGDEESGMWMCLSEEGQKCLIPNSNFTIISPFDQRSINLQINRTSTTGKKEGKLESVNELIGKMQYGQTHSTLMERIKKLGGVWRFHEATNFIDLIQRLVEYHPHQRLSPQQALFHPFFDPFFPFNEFFTEQSAARCTVYNPPSFTTFINHTFNSNPRLLATHPEEKEHMSQNGLLQKLKLYEAMMKRYQQEKELFKKQHLLKFSKVKEVFKASKMKLEEQEQRTKAKEQQLNAEIEKLKQTKATYLKELDLCNQNFNSLSQTFKEEKKKNEELKKELEDNNSKSKEKAKKMKSMFQEHKCKLELQNKQLTQTLDCSNQHIASLNTEIASLKDSLKCSEEAREKQREHISQLTQKNKMRETQLIQEFAETKALCREQVACLMKYLK